MIFAWRNHPGAVIMTCTNPLGGIDERIRGPKYSLLSEGRLHFVTIASDHAVELNVYLRSLGIRTEPPEPYQTNVDCIHLGRGVNAQAVQAVLDRWK